MPDEPGGSPQSGDAARYLKAAEARAATLRGAAAWAKPRPLARIGVVGAGTMGQGIALACLYVGFQVCLLDEAEDALQRAAAKVGSDLQGRVAKGRMTQAESLAAGERFSTTTDLAVLANVDLVIEAVFESLEVKRNLFAILDKVCRPGCVLATNTSTLDVDAIAAATARPHDVVGLHFFSPANIMRLLEVIRGRATGADILATAMALAHRLDKTAVIVGNCYGFAGNRMGEGLGREANLMLLEGAAPQEVDRALTAFGMAMGPFTVADVVGVDVPYRARRENSQAAPGDLAYYRMADLLAETGRFGQKTGRGYYRYPDGPRHPQADPEVQAFAAAEAARLGIAPASHDDDEIVDRCVLPMINEGCKILAEGIAVRPSDLDVIFVAGYGFPPERGGPMAHADRLGLPEVLRRIQRYETRFATAYWRPADLLVELVGQNRRLADLNAA